MWVSAPFYFDANFGWRILVKGVPRGTFCRNSSSEDVNLSRGVTSSKSKHILQFRIHVTSRDAIAIRACRLWPLTFNTPLQKFKGWRGILIQILHRYSNHAKAWPCTAGFPCCTLIISLINFRPNMNFKTLLSSLDIFSLISLREFKFWSVTFM